jgi:hypothetical protein
MKNYKLLGLADQFEKVAGAGERVWIVLYVEANSALMVQGVYSSEEKANAWMKYQSVRPEIAQRMLVRSFVIDSNPEPPVPAAPPGGGGGPGAVATR